MPSLVQYGSVCDSTIARFVLLVFNCSVRLVPLPKTLSSLIPADRIAFSDEP
ncbi:hypothetical protein D3C81_1587100 [compost metagenome]